MRYIPVDLRILVIQRAHNRCEYCQLSQEGQEATFHIDHVIPVAAQGKTSLENLALACVSCSLRKSARLTVVDPETKNVVNIYNPRKDHWNDHFEWRDVILNGLTSTGRATILALDLNRSLICAIRKEEKARGRHPYL